jgi:hypothetical protein
MSSERRISRRTFLTVARISAAAATSAGVVELVRRSGHENHNAGPHDPLTVRVGSLFGGGASTRAVGAAYLREHPDEAHEQRLVQLLRESDGGWKTLSSRAELRRLGSVEATRDYYRRRVVVVEGWYLSLTEARLCALTTFA